MKIALVVYWYPFNSSPSLINLSRDLAVSDELQLYIDPRFSQNIEASIEALLANRILHLKYIVNSGNEGLAQRTKPRPFIESAIYSVRAIANLLLPKFAKNEFKLIKYYSRWLASFSKSLRSIPRDTIIIAADKFSLLPLVIALRIPHCYYSLEATPLREESSLLCIFLNILEKLYLAIFSPIVICQSIQRSRHLQVHRSRLALIPVTCDGPALSRSKEIREHFRIDDSKILVICAGGMGVDDPILEIINSTTFWPDNFILLLHSNNCNFPRNILEAVSANSTNIILSDLELNAEQANIMIYSAADIGIVLYRGLTSNLRETAFSSGKLAAFLRAGVPVLLPDFKEYDPLLSQFQVGLKTNSSNIVTNLTTIVAEHEFFSLQARMAYSSIYNYSNYRGLVSRLLRKIYSVDLLVEASGQSVSL